MYELQCLVKRHVLRFLRDKAAVFFSFLSILIMLALYFLFIGKQYTSYDAMDIFTDEFKTYLTVGVMMGGILVINTVTLSLGMMGNIIMDLEQRKLDGFLVTPIKRYKIILSYYIAAIMITTVLSLVMWVLTILYVGISSGYWYSLQIIMEASGLLIIFTFISSTLMVFLTTLLKSVNAFGALSGILGTFIGFVSGIYMPLFILGKGTTFVASVIPFTHMTIMLRNVLLREPLAVMMSEYPIPPQVLEHVKMHYGINEIGVFGMDVPMIFIMLFSGLLSFVLLFFTYRRMTKKISK